VESCWFECVYVENSYVKLWIVSVCEYVCVECWCVCAGVCV